MEALVIEDVHVAGGALAVGGAHEHALARRAAARPAREPGPDDALAAVPAEEPFDRARAVAARRLVEEALVLDANEDERRAREVALEGGRIAQGEEALVSAEHALALGPERGGLLGRAVGGYGVVRGARLARRVEGRAAGRAPAAAARGDDEEDGQGEGGRVGPKAALIFSHGGCGSPDWLTLSLPSGWVKGKANIRNRKLGTGNALMTQFLIPSSQFPVGSSSTARP